jgi:hypothetical protein
MERGEPVIVAMLGAGRRSLSARHEESRLGSLEILKDLDGFWFVGALVSATGEGMVGWL